MNLKFQKILDHTDGNLQKNSGYFIQSFLYDSFYLELWINSHPFFSSQTKNYLLFPFHFATLPF